MNRLFSVVVPMIPVAMIAMGSPVTHLQDEGTPSAPAEVTASSVPTGSFQTVLEHSLDLGVTAQTVLGLSGVLLAPAGEPTRVVSRSTVTHLDGVMLSHTSSLDSVPVNGATQISFGLGELHTGIGLYKAALALNYPESERLSLYDTGQRSAAWVVRIAPTVDKTWADVSSEADLLVSVVPSE